jgi:nitrate/nitrite-specific signal transduction histidine kinase
VYLPVSNLDGEEVAFLKLSMPREIYKSGKSMIKLLFLSLGILFLMFFISTVIFNYLLSKKITTPLSDLKKMAKEINEGNLNPEFNFEKDNEINPLAESIKKMLDALKESQRTLEEKVKQRTKELESKNRELEKLNRIFVDREIRMKKLKEEIKKLKGGN